MNFTFYLLHGCCTILMTHKVVKKHIQKERHSRWKWIKALLDSAHQLWHHGWQHQWNLTLWNSELSAQFTLQETWGLKNFPLLHMFFADNISGCSGFPALYCVEVNLWHKRINYISYVFLLLCLCILIVMYVLFCIFHFHCANWHSDWGFSVLFHQL